MFYVFRGACKNFYIHAALGAQDNLMHCKNINKMGELVICHSKVLDFEKCHFKV
jgi:hypothetical protein